MCVDVFVYMFIYAPHNAVPVDARGGHQISLGLGLQTAVSNMGAEN